MKEYLSDNTTTVDFFVNLDQEVAFNVLDCLLKTTADLLQCKIVVFYKEQNEYLYIISYKASPTESPLYIFREWDGKYSLLTAFERTKGSSVRHKGKGLRDFVASIFNTTPTTV